MPGKNNRTSIHNYPAWDIMGNGLGREGRLIYINLRQENNWIKFTPPVQWEYSQVYVDLQLEDQWKATDIDDLPVGRSVGYVDLSDGRPVSWLITVDKVISNGSTTLIIYWLNGKTYRNYGQGWRIIRDDSAESLEDDRVVEFLKTVKLAMDTQLIGTTSMDTETHLISHDIVRDTDDSILSETTEVGSDEYHLNLGNSRDNTYEHYITVDTKDENGDPAKYLLAYDHEKQDNLITDDSINLDSNSNIAVAISEEPGNLITLESDGLSAEVDLSNYYDKDEVDDIFDILGNKPTKVRDTTNNSYDYIHLADLNVDTDAVIGESALLETLSQIGLGFFVYKEISNDGTTLVAQGNQAYDIADNVSWLSTSATSWAFGLTLNDATTISIYQYDGSAWNKTGDVMVEPGYLFSRARDNAGIYRFSEHWSQIDASVDLSNYYTIGDVDNLLTSYVAKDSNNTVDNAFRLTNGTTSVSVSWTGLTATGLGTFNGVDSNNNKVVNVANPTNTGDAVNKGYLDTRTDGLTFWNGTQAEYDTLGTYDNDTIYFIN